MKLDELKRDHLDKEHEQEIILKQDRYDILSQERTDEKLRMGNEIIGLKEVIKVKDTTISERESKIKKLTEQIEQLNVNLQALKKLNEMKDKEFKELKIRLNESEKIVQEKTKLASFSSKLKNELYRKNTEIMGEFNQQQGDINEMKNNSKNTEKELGEALRDIENYEKEVNKYKNMCNEMKKRCDGLIVLNKKKEQQLDELLQKFYEIYKSNDKKKILKGVNQIYISYITPDVIKKIDSSKLNPNIRDELEKQIEFLQNSLVNMNEVKSKKEGIQKNELFKRTDQNSLLINELNEKKRTLSLIERDYNKLKSDYSAIKKTMDNVKREEKNKFNSSQRSQVKNK
jgi:chromosome segregation ATPase